MECVYIREMSSEEFMFKKSKAPIWRHFKINYFRTRAKCNACNQVLSCKNGATSSLLSHMKSIHNVNVMRRKDSMYATSCTESPGTAAKEQKRKLNTSVQPNKPFDHYLSELVAVLGMSFSQLIHPIMLSTFAAQGYNTKGSLRSPSVVRDRVLAYAMEIRSKTIDEISAARAHSLVSCSMEEWTSSLQNKRYASITVHISGKNWNLGLFRIKDNNSAEECLQRTSEILLDYGINLMVDVAGITTDGSDVLVKMGKLLDDPIHHQCYARGLHLALLDVMYMKNDDEMVEVISWNEEEGDDYFDESELLEDSAEFTCGFVQDTTTVPFELTVTHQIRDVIDKVRRAVRLCHKSPLEMDEIIKPNMQKEPGNVGSLRVDNRKRWDTLLRMVEQFMALKESVPLELVNSGSDIHFKDDEWRVMGDIVAILKSVELALEKLCRKDSNLLTADFAMEFLISNLPTSNLLADDMKRALQQRICERRTITSAVLQYLLYGANKDHLRDTNISETEIVNFITDFCYKFRNQNEVQVIISDLEDIEDISQGVEQNRNNIALLEVARELEVFQENRKRGPNLEFVLKSLKSIQCTSTERNHFFSGRILNKLRTRLGDETIYQLSMLKSYLNSN